MYRYVKYSPTPCLSRYGRLFLFLIAACLLPVRSVSGNANNMNAELETLVRNIEVTRKKRDVPAVAVVIVDKDQVLWSGSFGTADRNTNTPVKDTTMFRIGSITKMFTGLAMLKLQEEEILDLDARVKDIMPDFPMHNDWEHTYPLKVAHFLEHTSGITGLNSTEFHYPEFLDLDTAIHMFAEARKAEWPPGMHHVYSNAGPGMAAYLLEYVSGMKFEEYVREKILLPLGMVTSSLLPDPYTLEHLATGYDSDGYSVIPYWHVFYRAFGALNVTPSEMGPFIRMLLNKGELNGRRLFDTRSIERLETPETTLAARTGLKYGYGLGNYTYLRRGVLFHGHGGDADGYLSRLGYNRDRMMGYFLVINVFRNADLTRFRHMIEDFIIGDFRPDEPAIYPLSARILARYTGRYTSLTSRFNRPGKNRRAVIRFSADDGGLILQRQGERYRLIPVNDRHFRREGEPVATAAFSTGEDGRIYFQDDRGNYRKQPPQR